MAERPEKDNRRGGRKGRRKVCAFCVDKVETIDYKDIARLMLDEYVGSLKEKGIAFTYDDKAVEFLAEHSCTGKSGARDLRNYIRKEVEDAVTNEIVYHGEGAISKINVTETDGKIKLETE